MPDDSLRTLQNGVEEMAGVVHAGIPWVVSAVDQDPHGMRGIALGLCEHGRRAQRDGVQLQSLIQEDGHRLGAYPTLTTLSVARQ